MVLARGLMISMDNSLGILRRPPLGMYKLSQTSITEDFLQLVLPLAYPHIVVSNLVLLGFDKSNQTNIP